jgi:hypothetical protein
MTNWTKLGGLKTSMVGSTLALLMLAGTAATSMAAPAPAEMAANTIVAQSSGNYCQQVEAAAEDAYQTWTLFGNDVDYYRLEYFIQLGVTYCGW